MVRRLNTHYPLDTFCTLFWLLTAGGASAQQRQGWSPQSQSADPFARSGKVKVKVATPVVVYEHGGGNGDNSDDISETSGGEDMQDQQQRPSSSRSRTSHQSASERTGSAGGRKSGDRGRDLFATGDGQVGVRAQPWCAGPAHCIGALLSACIRVHSVTTKHSSVVKSTSHRTCCWFAAGWAICLMQSASEFTGTIRTLNQKESLYSEESDDEEVRPCIAIALTCQAP